MRLDILSGPLPSLSCVFFLHYSDEVRQIQTLTILRRRCKFGFMPQSTHNAPLFATFLWRLCEDERSIAIYSSVVPETFKTHLGFGRGVDARAMFHAMKKRSFESLTASGPKYVSLHFMTFHVSPSFGVSCWGQKQIEASNVLILKCVPCISVRCRRRRRRFNERRQVG